MFVPNLVFLTRPSLQILGKTQTGVFPISGISGQSLIKRNCHNSRTSGHINMKLGAVTKIDKRSKAMSRKFDDDARSENCDVITIFPIYDQFEQSGSRIPDVESVKLIFSSIVTFYLTKTKNRTKKSLT